MGFEPMSLWLYTLSILMGGGNVIWVQAHWLQVFNMSVLFQRFMYLFIWEELYVYVTLFSLSLPFFFFLGGWLYLWNILWDIEILQLCFVHLLVPSGNWLALNIICGLLVMEFAYCYSLIYNFFLFSCDIVVASVKDLKIVSFIFAPKNIAGHPLDYVHLFTLNRVFLQGHSKSAAPATCVISCISNPWSKLS